MNFDDSAKFVIPGHVVPFGEHLCPECERNGRSTWTPNKIFCDRCIEIRASFGYWTPAEAPSVATKKCLTAGCRRKVEGRKRFCTTCVKFRNRRLKREHMRRKRGSDVEKTQISPIGAQALTKAKVTNGYHHPETSISDASFSTGQASAQDASGAAESIDSEANAVAL